MSLPLLLWHKVIAIWVWPTWAVATETHLPLFVKWGPVFAFDHHLCTEELFRTILVILLHYRYEQAKYEHIHRALEVKDSIVTKFVVEVRLTMETDGLRLERGWNGFSATLNDVTIILRRLRKYLLPEKGLKNSCRKIGISPVDLHESILDWDVRRAVRCQMQFPQLTLRPKRCFLLFFFVALRPHSGS